MHRCSIAALAAGCSLMALIGVAPAGAEQLVVAAPLLSAGPGDPPVASEGASFVNHGLVGVGRLSAGGNDFLGDTLGSFSGMAIDAASWKRDGDTYTGRLLTVPDRGYNNPDDKVYSDFQGRLVESALTFVPGKALTIAPTGKGIALTDFDGKPTTGAEPGAGTTTEAGHVLPSPKADALGAGKVSLDAEAVALTSDGGFYVGDEYTAGIYLFGADGRMKGFIAPDAALAPMKDGAVNFNSDKAPDTGRRNNQGMEAVALTPDGKKLVAVLQSAAIQDSSASKNQANRANTRIFVYDLAASPTPAAASEVYALTLPVLAGKGDGKIDKTAAQSEVLALDDHRFLVLARDGNGRGCGCDSPEVFKTILLVDTKGATNLAGTAFASAAKPIAPASDEKNTLDPSITPASATVLVNLLNPKELAAFGLNLHNEEADQHTLSEKWEAMALVPALDPAAPDDYFLFVGNDNDFLTKSGMMQGKPYDAGLDNDNMLLAYRLTLPGVAARR
jgi:hypothetical protein